MLLNGLVDSSGAAVMQEEQALSGTPQRRRTELPAVGIALGNVVSESRSHIVHGEVTERLERHVALPGHGRLSGGLSHGMAGPTTDNSEHLPVLGRRPARRDGNP